MFRLYDHHQGKTRNEEQLGARHTEHNTRAHLRGHICSRSAKNNSNFPKRRNKNYWFDFCSVEAQWRPFISGLADIRVEDFTAMKIHIVLFWVVTQCSLLGWLQSFRGAFLPWRCEQNFPSKHRPICKLHVVTIQQSTIWIDCTLCLDRRK
jgi:hypothetical protein